MTADRSIAPEIKRVQEVKPLEYTSYYLENHIPVYHTPQGDSELFRLVVRFDGGQAAQHRPLQAQLTMRMLEEGTSLKSATQIAEYLDFFGASLVASFEKDFSSLMLKGLKKDFKELTGLLGELIGDPVFPEKEFNLLRSRMHAQFKTNIRKKAYRAGNEMHPILFGDDHPYGHKITEEAFKQISRESLVDYYEENVKNGHARIFVLGIDEDEAQKILNENLENLHFCGERKLKIIPIQKENQRKELHLGEEKAFQSAIRLGWRVVNRQHPDYIDLKILNTILGGFFGSRLMKNLREEKGLTYGVGSAISSTLQSGIWTIATEVGAEYTQEALEEIYREINRLKTEKIHDEDLNLIKNYLPGNIVRSLAKDFDKQRAFIDLSDHELLVDYYSKYLKHINDIDADRIRELANEYLLFDKISEVVVGKI